MLINLIPNTCSKMYTWIMEIIFHGSIHHYLIANWPTMQGTENIDRNGRVKQFEHSALKACWAASHNRRTKSKDDKSSSNGGQGTWRILVHRDFMDPALAWRGSLTHICGSKLGHHWFITWTLAGKLLIRQFRTTFDEIWIRIQYCWYKKMNLKMFAKWQSFGFGLNVLSDHPLYFCYW